MVKSFQAILTPIENKHTIWQPGDVVTPAEPGSAPGSPLHAWNTSLRSRPEGILARCLNHLKWLLWMSNGSPQSLLRAPHPISKPESRYPSEEVHFWHLYLSLLMTFHSLWPYAMVPNRPVNWQLHSLPQHPSTASTSLQMPHHQSPTPFTLDLLTTPQDTCAPATGAGTHSQPGLGYPILFWEPVASDLEVPILISIALHSAANCPCASWRSINRIVWEKWRSDAETTEPNTLQPSSLVAPRNITNRLSDKGQLQWEPTATGGKFKLLAMCTKLSLWLYEDWKQLKLNAHCRHLSHSISFMLPSEHAGTWKEEQRFFKQTFQSSDGQSYQQVEYCDSAAASALLFMCFL